MMFGLALERGSLHQAWRDFSAMDWDWRGGVEDVGSTQAYQDAFQRPRLVGQVEVPRVTVVAGEITQEAQRSRYEARSGVRRATEQVGVGEGDRP